jgi:uncharacterized protein (DUF2147 family)
MTRLAALTATLILLSTQAFSADPVGEWLVADEGARIGIQPCGEALCGNIVWTKSPSGVDEKNPDPEKRSRPILGLEILQSMKPSGPERWEGTVYNALNGKTYKAFMTVSAEKPDVLKLEGCILGGLICGGEDWTRVKETTTAAPGAVPPSGSPRPQPAAKARGKASTTGSVPPAAQASPEPAAKPSGKDATTGSVLFGTPARPQPAAKSSRPRSEAPPQ